MSDADPASGDLRDRLHRAAGLARDQLAHTAVDRWELYAKASTTRSVVVDHGRTVETVETEETGVAVRTLVAGRCGFGAASGLEVASGRRAVDSALSCAVEVAEDPLPPPRLLSSSPVRPAAPPPARGWPAHAVAELRRAVTAASSGRVQLSRAVVDAGGAGWLLATAEGFVATHEESSTGIGLELLLDDGHRGRWREWLRVPEPGALSAEVAARRIVDRILLTGAPLCDGLEVHDLLLHPEVAGHLLAALSPLFLARPGNADPLPRLLDGAGCLASPSLTVVDSRLGDGVPVGGPCDGEGLPATRTLLLEDGVPRHRLASYADAIACGEPPRGGAVRLSFRDPPRSGISNLAVDVAAGLSPARLLAAGERLCYLLRLVSPVTCDLERNRYRLVASGVWVEHGRLTGWHPVVELEGRITTLLRRVEAVGSDLTWLQTAAGWVGAPSVLARSVTATW